MNLLKQGVAFLILMGAALPIPKAQASEHTTSKHLVDLSTSHWCYDCAEDVLDKYQVMVGFSDHTFRGDRAITRYELAATLLKVQKKLFRAQGLSLAYPDTPDVLMLRENHWARSAALELVNERGLMTRWSNNFRGRELASREDLAYGLSEILRVFNEKEGRYLKAPERVSQLGIDLPARSPYYNGIQQVLNQELMNLYSDHTFRPTQSVTRYALAASLCRLFGQTLD